MKYWYVVSGVVGALLLGIVLWFFLQSSEEIVMAPTTETLATSADATETTATSSRPATPEEVLNDIEPLLMALDMKTWEWQEARFADGRVVTPAKAGEFTLAFGGSGTVEIGTDCNSMTSTYEAYSGGLTFGSIASTKMYCEGSQEAEFAALLDKFATYQFTGKGELIVKTSDDTKVIFR
jgi:heat shock protein HslJ